MSKSSKPALLQDNSWIRKTNKSEDTVEQDPNFGRSVLKGYKYSETTGSPEDDGVKTTKTITTSTSVQALSKRFGSQDELRSSTTLPPSKTTTSSTKYTSKTLKSDPPITTTKTIVVEDPKSSTTTTTITKNGTTETTITTTETVSSPVIKSPTKTETFSERVKASSKDPQYSAFSPSKTTKVTETTVTSIKDVDNKPNDTFSLTNITNDLPSTNSTTSSSKTETVVVKSSNDAQAEDELYGTLIPKSFKDDLPSSKTTISSTETVTVKSGSDGDSFKTTTLTRTSSRSDDLYDTYLPKVTTSSVSSPVSSDRTYLYSRPDSSYEYTSITSPTSYSSSLYSSRSDDILSDPVYSRSSIKNVYASPERTVLEKDLCTSCRKPFTGDAKIVLDEMKINCHATCFKCEECNGNLGHLKAGDSMWVYKRKVHCEPCFETTRAKWRL